MTASLIRSRLAEFRDLWRKKTDFFQLVDDKRSFNPGDQVMLLEYNAQANRVTGRYIKAKIETVIEEPVAGIVRLCKCIVTVIKKGDDNTL